MTSRYRLAFPRPDTPELCKNHSPKTEGAGKAGCPLHPQPRVRNKSTRVSHHRSTGTPGIPCAMVLTVSFVLLCDRLVCHRHRADMAGRGPVGPTSPPRDLTPASGRHDHTTSPSASAPFVRALFARLTLPRPPHPVPYVRDDHDTPLCVGRDGGGLEVIWVGGEAKYFSRRGWTANQ